MSSNKNFEVLVIGGGPGGYVAAIRAAQLGINTACVEENKLGGVCLNVGCIPTKALLTSAALCNEMKAASSHGITFNDIKKDLGPAQERSRAISDQLTKGVKYLLRVLNRYVYLFSSVGRLPVLYSSISLSSAERL